MSPHKEDPSTSVQETRKEIRKILVGSIAIPIDGGPPRFEAVPSRRSSKIVTPQPQNLVDVHPMHIRNIEVFPELVNRNKFPIGSQVLIMNHCISDQGKIMKFGLEIFPLNDALVTYVFLLLALDDRSYFLSTKGI